MRSILSDQIQFRGASLHAINPRYRALNFQIDILKKFLSRISMIQTFREIRRVLLLIISIRLKAREI